MYRASRACILSCYVRCIKGEMCFGWVEESPEMQYFWKAPAEGQDGQERNSAQSCTWAFGSDIFREGVFVISNETLGRSYVVKLHDPNICKKRESQNRRLTLIILHHCIIDHPWSFTFFWPWGIQRTESGQSVFGFSESYVASWKDCHQRPMPRSCMKVTRQNDNRQPYFFRKDKFTNDKHMKKKTIFQTRSNKIKWQADQNFKFIFAFEAWPISCHVSTCLA